MHFLFRTLACLCVFICSKPVHAQSLLALDTSNCCLMPGKFIGEALYALDSSDLVQPMVRQILDKAKLPLNFSMVNTNVQAAAAVITKNKRYLLYNHEFFYENQRAKHLCYAFLALEIAHLSNPKHTCSPKFRQREESEAWLFTGRIMQAFGFSEETTLSVADYPGYGYALSVADRKKHLKEGWGRADAFLQSQKTAGYLGNKAVLDKLPLPEFELPAPDCAARREFKPAFAKKPADLGAVNAHLCKGLDAKGYEQRSYYYVPNGFALVTQLEQCKKDGTSLAGADRWKDYPVPEQFTDIWTYLKDLVLPSTARFRFFVFLVTDQNISITTNRALSNPDQIRDWLQKGGTSLPEVMEKWPFSNGHKITLLVYELEGNGSKNGTKRKCPADQITVHLKGSGLDKALPERR